MERKEEFTIYLKHKSFSPRHMLAAILVAGNVFVSASEVWSSTVISPTVGIESSRQSKGFTLHGVVSDESGSPMVGVNVRVVRGSKTVGGVATDMSGKYSIKVSEGDTVIFSFIGMQEQKVTVKSGMDTLNITLKDSATHLDDVVVTGYQTISKERATGAYAIISEKSTRGKLETDILSRIEGTVAGISKPTANGVVIRGVTTYMGNSTPLIVVDGMPYEGSLSSINPGEVSNITVLKDAAASSIYGARAANGVIVVTTKRGKDGKTSVSYNGSIRFDPIPDIDYLDLMDTRELIGLQREGFAFFHPKLANVNPRYYMDPVIGLLYKHEEGELSDSQLQSELDRYGALDNRQQILEEFARVGMEHQHNVALSGGNAKNRYRASLDYTQMMQNQKFNSQDRIGFSIKDDMNLFPWMTANVGISGNYTQRKSDDGAEAYNDMVVSMPSYQMIKDNDGNPIPVPTNKSQMELDRLRGLGLKDETYIPILNRPLESTHNTSAYYRIQAGVNFKLWEGLHLDLKYQTESSYTKNRSYKDGDSYYVRNMINDAAQYDEKRKELTLNVPEGGQLGENRSDSYSYTLRGQLNFNRTMGNHYVTALAGAERRLVRSTGTRSYYMGYDDSSLNITPVNPFPLTDLRNTESLRGFFSWSWSGNNRLTHNEDRYVSFYANSSYTYDEKYSLTGSIRIDQSNLFGTDPRYQYRPLWSLGGSWHLGKEDFMREASWLDQLTLRLTYGIGGNIPKAAGPYMTVENYGWNSWVGDFSSMIVNPPNDQLRWEKTSTTNIGVDFSIFSSKLSGSIDVYNKDTKDLLGERNADPTLGWSKLLVNYGSMYNRGVELSLRSQNVRQGDFAWDSSLTFSCNKNELTNLEGTQESVYYFTASSVNTVGYPMNSLFSYRYAGLDPKNGNVRVYDKEGKMKSNVDSIDDLVWSGTRTPVYNASLKNLLSYKGLELSFMFVYYGGHVMRDVVAVYLSQAPGNNLNRKQLNYWKKPGDENIPDIAPSFKRSISEERAMAWYSADAHIRPADYIKLRDVSLSYNIPAGWLKKLSLSSALLTCQLSNVWWWAANGDIDPEAYATSGYGRGARTLPNPMTYTLGLSLNF